MATSSFGSKIKVTKKQAKKLVEISKGDDNVFPDYAVIKSNNKMVEAPDFIDRLKKSFIDKED